VTPRSTAGASSIQSAQDADPPPDALKPRFPANCQTFFPSENDDVFDVGYSCARKNYARESIQNPTNGSVAYKRNSSRDLFVKLETPQ
jgi:hypothetical protein